MRTNARHVTRRHADRLVGDSAARSFRIFLSVSETWKSATVGRAKDRLACRFRLDGRMQASRLHAPVKSEPVCGDHSAHRRDMRAFQSQALGAKSHSGGFWRAVGPLFQTSEPPRSCTNLKLLQSAVCTVDRWSVLATVPVPPSAARAQRVFCPLSASGKCGRGINRCPSSSTGARC